MNAALTAVGHAADSEVWRLPGGRQVRLRPLAPEDLCAEKAFFNGLSRDSRQQRFHFGLRELSPALLKLLTDVDQRLHRAWVVEADEPGRRVIADARFVCDPAQPGMAEFALAVADDWQGRGLGRRLIAHLIAQARRQGLRQLYGDVQAENRRMLALMREFGMRLRAHADGAQLVRAVLALDVAAD
ncbi:GNAT family N-acetyltransferase [Roseateles saccharophilus]|uniref:Acetyltransferase n=1 Tax=Roseateles saccharophilus TaxID=304 RepID=A0A4R3VES0_ROSSA|nr:GNAT family N-acetyltransferase [Roseateles saccharophilus]TCV03896.1 acetyltransferase [Roseateles saccharophilus]